jgi:Family of unknown function (DUF6441)
MIIARNLVQGNAQRRLPGSIGCTDSPGGEERAPVEIGLDDQHHVLTTGGPPMKLVATLARSLQADMETELREIELAVAAGMQGAGRALKTELRRQVASAGLGQRVANSWRDRHYPNQKLDAASVVYTKAPQIIRAFDEGAVIRSNRGRFLAIPTENAPRKGTDGKRISPRTFPEHRFGPLRFVPRPSGPSLLVVDGLRASLNRKTGELRGFRRATERARRSGQGLTAVVMFLLSLQATTNSRHLAPSAAPSGVLSRAWCSGPPLKRCRGASCVVVKVVEGDPHLTREREQRRAQQAKGDHKQNADELFVPDAHKGAGECQYDEHGCADAAADGKVDRAVHELCPVLQARNVGLEASPRGIVVGYHVQAADPIDDAAHPGDQDGNKGGYRAEKEGWRRCVRDDLGELAEVRYVGLHVRGLRPRKGSLGTGRPRQAPPWRPHCVTPTVGDGDTLSHLGPRGLAPFCLCGRRQRTSRLPTARMLTVCSRSP